MSWRRILRDAAKDAPPVIVLVAVGFLDGVDGAAGFAIAFGAYSVALAVWALVQSRRYNPNSSPLSRNAAPK